MAALLPTATSVPSVKIQADLDANFDAFMDREYADDQIGELEEEVENDD
jgi:protein LTV1